MEEYAGEGCSIVYFCASVEEDIYELYQKSSPPQAISESHNEHISLDQTYENVRTLLDEDLGGFDEVFLCSRSESCLDRLDTYANTLPTVVLVELHNTYNDGRVSPSFLKEKKRGAFAFLRSLSNDVQGARFQKHVLPFALLTFDKSAPADPELDSTITSSCLRAGAVDIIKSPLRHEDIYRLIGHIKDVVRPPAKVLAAHMAQNLVDSIRNYSEPRIACHRPDLIISSERKAAVEKAVPHWHFPASDFNMDELTYAAMIMLEHILRTPELEAYGLERPQLMSFLLSTRRQYKHEREVHYHNWRHAVDVTQSVYCFALEMQLCPASDSNDAKRDELNGVERIITPLDALILIVSAIGHDVGHPGVNNAFLVACNHPLAQAYNDKSVLENYHCAAYSQLLRRHWSALHNIAGFRATMISTILATDMQRHFEYMKSLAELKAKTESSEVNVDNWSDKEREQTRELLMGLLIKAADISNVARPFDISANWAKVLMNEFARQGELEVELQIPTCLFGGPPDREDILAAAQSQKGFMNLFGFPLFHGIAELMPRLSCSVQEMLNNRDIWDTKIGEEQEKRKPGADTPHPTFSNVTNEEVEEAVAHHRSEPNAVPEQAGQIPTTPTKRAVANGAETSPTRHPAHDLRQHLAQGVTFDEGKRSSAPLLGSPSVPLTSSRRSSKDVALDSIQQLTVFANQSLGPTPDARRGSADAGWQIHRSYPNSRRGSKDESLTTILVTSGGSPNSRSSSSSPSKAASPSKPGGKRQSVSRSQKGMAARTSVPSSRSQATSTATATTTQASPSTQPSTQPSPIVRDEGDIQPFSHHASIPSTEDPFMVPGNWPTEMDGMRGSSPENTPRELSSTPPTPPEVDEESKTASAPIISQVSTGEIDGSRDTPRQGEKGIRESRSRSRLRSLKFWKKRKDKDVASADASTTNSPSGSP